MSIKLSDKAATEIKTILNREIENNRLSPQAGLRLMVQGGGCAGFTYRMAFDENQRDSDKVLELEGIKFLVDQQSYLYLKGTEIDYQDGLTGQGFAFHNPNATGSCGCDSSFSA